MPSQRCVAAIQLCGITIATNASISIAPSKRRKRTSSRGLSRKIFFHVPIVGSLTIDEYFEFSAAVQRSLSGTNLDSQLEICCNPPRGRCCFAGCDQSFQRGEGRSHLRGQRDQPCSAGQATVDARWTLRLRQN